VARAIPTDSTSVVKFNASPTAKKYRKCQSSIAEFHYAENAWLHKEMISREEIQQSFDEIAREMAVYAGYNPCG